MEQWVSGLIHLLPLTTVCKQPRTDYKPAAIPQEMTRLFRTSSVTSVTWPHTTQRNSAGGSLAEEERKLRRMKGGEGEEEEEEEW